MLIILAIIGILILGFFVQVAWEGLKIIFNVLFWIVIFLVLYGIWNS